MYQLLLIANRKFRLIPWPVKTKGTLPLPLFHISHNLNHVSAYHYHVTFSRLSLGLSLSLRCTLALCSSLTLCLCSWLINKIQRNYFVMMPYLTGSAANTGLAITAYTYQYQSVFEPAPGTTAPFQEQLPH